MKDGKKKVNDICVESTGVRVLREIVRSLKFRIS